MRLYIDSIREARSAATALAEYLDAEARKLQHNRIACGCSWCSAYHEAIALLATVIKLNEQR